MALTPWWYSFPAGFLQASHDKMYIWLYLFISRLMLFSFFHLCTPVWVPTRCCLQVLISMGWCHHFCQEICWDHIISSYLSRLFTYSFKHICFSFLLPHFVQGLKYCDSVISNSSLHFPQWFFLNNMVQNLYVWFSSFPHIKISLSALSSNNLVKLKFIVCNKGFKSFCICNYQSSSLLNSTTVKALALYDKTVSLELIFICIISTLKITY